MAEAIVQDSTDTVRGATPAVVADNLTRYFGQGNRQVKAVDGVSFTIQAGELTAITGPSGSGKTTLLYLMGSLEKPGSGSLVVGDTNIASLSNHAATAFRRRKVGFIFQAFNLVPNLSAIENVMLPMEFVRQSKSERQSRAIALLEMVGITGPQQHHWPGKLSGGEQQRVAIARALANRPEVILADEPTGNLDSENGNKVIDELRQLARQGVAVVLVTHDNNIARRADTRIVMRDGKIVMKGSKNE
jgi:ABC-type lipoprotein export system ATPase subunit